MAIGFVGNRGAEVGDQGWRVGDRRIAELTYSESTLDIKKSSLRSQ